jgi:DNA-binding LacI/PurR family transcriptional regulator/signal transduction histidine kinase
MSNRKTIGLIINNIDGNIQPLLLKSVKKAAEKFDCNLIIFEGGIINSDNGVARQHNVVYKLIDKDRIDGLIVPGCLIMDKVGYEGIIEFCEQFKNIPLISVGMEVPGATSLLVDNKTSMKSLVEHMVKDHGYRKVAFIKGPKTNSEANDRFEAYLEVLKENNIEIDNNLIFDGNWEAETGYLIMKHILSNNIKYDALVSANDDMAHGAIMCLKDIESSDDNIDVSQYYTIAGFDDTLNARMMKPSLSTVKQPFEEIYFNAVELLLKKINNEKIDNVITFPGILIKRESCGCMEKEPSNTLPDSSLRVFTGYRLPENLQTFSTDDLLNKLTDALPGCFIRSCFVSEYSEGPIVFEYNGDLPYTSNLIYAYHSNYRIEIEDEANYFKTKDIIPDSYFPDRQFTFLLQPLFFNNEQFGFVWFEGVNDIFYLYESLRGFLSTTLKGAKMLAEIKKMEEILHEKERLTSLGQLIGGISHSFNTPIMSISGACVGLEDLLRELKESVGDSKVTTEDYYEIAQEMQSWLNNLKGNNSYMSEVINAIKNQAVQLNASTSDEFTMEELMSKINLFINNDLKVNKYKFNIISNIDRNTKIRGELSNLTMVIYNLIINASESYLGKRDREFIIDFSVNKNKDSLMFTIKDYGKGIEDNIKSRIFKQMVTTKGKNGNGLSLLLSFSAIKGRFKGDMWFETSEDQGTTFYISIPLNNSDKVGVIG